MSQPTALATHFDEAFSAPDGLKRLRELILTLAMQGKLVEQDPAEGTADDLLKEIETEKRRLVAEGKIKPSKPLPAIEPEEMPYELPEGWRWVRFGNVAQHNSGKTLDSGRNRGELRDYITTSNLYWGRFELENLRQMQIQEDELERCTARQGDLLLCEGGEAGRAAVWELDQEVCFQNHIHRARFYKDTDAHFAQKFFEKLNATGEIAEHRKGVGISNMSSKALAAILLPLPPLSEQRRIVARIEQLMARCDELEALRAQREHKRVQVQSAILREITADTDPATFRQNWKFLADHFGELHATPQNVAELRSAVLQLAVMGKLVPQDPAEGTARELLAEIEEEKRRLVAAGKIKAPKPLPPINEAEQPYQVPGGWAWVRLGAISSTRLGKMLDAGKNQGTFKPYLRNTNVQWERFDLNDVKEMKLKAEELKELALNYGDLLICEGGEPGRCAIWRDNETEMYFQKALHRVRPFSSIRPEWILLNLKNDALSKKLDRYFTGATIKHFPGEKLLMYFLALPPLAEQRRIVAKIDQLMELCDALEARLAERTAKQGELLRAIMAELAPTLSAGRPATPSRARAQAPTSADAPRVRGQPHKAAPEGAETAAQPVAERRGRGRPRKDGSSPGRSIPEAANMEDAIRRLEAQKQQSIGNQRMNGLFEKQSEPHNKQ